MDGGRSGTPDHLDDLDRGGAADDRIVDQDDPPAVQIGPASIVLEAHSEVPDLIGRLDERPSDIMVADDPEFEGQSRFLGIAERRRHAGIGDRNDDVRVDMALASEFPADAFAGLCPERNDALVPGRCQAVADAAKTGLLAR